MKRGIASIILIIAGLCVPQRIPGQTPAVSSFQPLPGLGRVQAINKSGEIAGQTGGGDEVQGVLIDQSGNITTISVPNSEQTLIYGMDNSTRIVGAYHCPVDGPPGGGMCGPEGFPNSGGAHGFLYFNGSFTTIDVPGGTDTRARSINDPNRIVGDFNGSDGKRHGFLYDGQNFTQIDVPGAVATYIYGLNNPGTMVGYYTDGNGNAHGFVSNTGTDFTTLDVNNNIPGVTATDTFLYSISNPGVIVGSYIDSAGTHGFVDAKGAFASIDAPDTPPGVGTFARGVNDNNQILIYGTIAQLTSVGN